jgi:hypothetical protein
MFESATSTQPFEGAGRLEFAVTYNGRGTLPVGAELRLGLVDAQSGQLVLPLCIFSGTNDTTATFSMPVTLPGQIQIRVLAQGIPNSAFYTMERWLYPQDEADAAPPVTSLANTVGVVAGKQLPATFALHPNHPNPFNPSTQIRFDLPEASNVSLIIYDILGRQVAELAKGEYEAGYHSVTWNASSFASGVYLARFVARQIEGGQASDASGAVKLSTTQKLVLTK